MMFKEKYNLGIDFHSGITKSIRYIYRLLYSAWERENKCWGGMCKSKSSTEDWYKLL